MLYSQQQALDILKIDQSTFVYWMRAVPRIQSLKGRGCRFKSADLLALGVIADATRGLGVGISTLAPLVPAIFELLADETLAVVVEQAIVIQHGAAQLGRLPVAVAGDVAVVVLPLRPTVDKIKAVEGLTELLPLEQLMFDNRA